MQTLTIPESDVLTQAEADLIRPYVTNLDRPVFGLRNLPEEVIAVLFAYYSRSRDPLRKNLVKLLSETWDTASASAALSREGLTYAEETARRFHERWVVGYGHASVAEHAVAHLAVEGLSIIGTKLIEDCRLASYTEKSTRYVVFDRDSFYPEPTLAGSAYAYLYTSTCQRLLDTYTVLMPKVIAAIETTTPKSANQTPAAHATACKAKACDILRYLLPASVRTNLGMTVGARELARMISKLLSSPLAEGQLLGTQIKVEGQLLIPTLLKHAEANPYLAETEAALLESGQAFDRLPAGEPFVRMIPCADPGTGEARYQPEDPDTAVRLVETPADAENRLITALLYGASEQGYPEIRNKVRELSADERTHVIEEAFRRRGPYDQPPRALEHLNYTFDVLIDYGAYRDLQRHRLCSQTTQLLSTRYGWSTPEAIGDLKLTSVYEQAMQQAASAHVAIARDYPHEAQYVLPLAYRKRTLFTLNLRELHQINQLRSGKQGHPSYRKIAQEMFRAVERVHPTIAQYISVDLNDYALARG